MSETPTAKQRFYRIAARLGLAGLALTGCEKVVFNPCHDKTEQGERLAAIAKDLYHEGRDSTFVPGEFTQEFYEKALASTVAIHFFPTGQPPVGKPSFTCSGFITQGKEHPALVTASHCLAIAEYAAATTLSVFRPDEPENAVVVESPAWRPDENYDQTVIALPADAHFPTVPIKADYALTPGRLLLTLGFPGALTLQVGQGNSLTYRHLTHAHTFRPDTNNPCNEFGCWLTGGLSFGHSGGPVFARDSDGNPVAVGTITMREDPLINDYPLLAQLYRPNQGKPGDPHLETRFTLIPDYLAAQIANN